MLETSKHQRNTDLNSNTPSGITNTGIAYFSSRISGRNEREDDGIIFLSTSLFFELKNEEKRRVEREVAQGVLPKSQWSWKGRQER